MYNLDVIILVGYRLNLAKTTQFRQWATLGLKII
ncbi:RhuM family protein [Dyadobacter koreensis]|nr:RhuM family protein [Dyadobacter koreensis]